MEALTHTPAQRLAALEERARFMRWLLARFEVGLMADLEDFRPGRGDEFWKAHLRYLISSAKDLRACMSEESPRILHPELRYRPDGAPYATGGVVEPLPPEPPGPPPFYAPRTVVTAPPRCTICASMHRP